MRALTEDQKTFFDENGYLLLRGFYPPAQLEEMRRRMHDLLTRVENRPKHMSYGFMDVAKGYEPDPYNPRNVLGMMNHVLADDYWFDQFTDTRIVSVIVDLLGQNIDFNNGKVRNKPPGYHCDQGWHQDFRYIPHSRPDLAAAITYLDPTDFEAGATEVVPGSHRRNWPTHDGYNIPDAEVPADRIEVLAAEPGDVVVIHVLVVHRAGHNYTPRARHTVINQYKAAESIDQWNNDCAYGGLPLARNGRPVMPRLCAAADPQGNAEIQAGTD